MRRTLHTYGDPIGVAWRCGCGRVMLCRAICFECGWVDPRLAPKREEGDAPKRACTAQRPNP